MTVSRKDGLFVVEITGGLLCARRYMAEENDGVTDANFLGIATPGRGAPVPIFILPVVKRPWFVMHGDGLYAQNDHDALAPLYHGSDAAQLLSCITDLLTSVENKRLRSIKFRKYGYAAAAVILTGFLLTALSAPGIFRGVLSPTGSSQLSTVDAPRASLSARSSVPAVAPDVSNTNPTSKNGWRTNLPELQKQLPQPQQAPAAAPADGWSLPKSVRAQLPAKLHKAASRGLFTVPLSGGHARTIYVFADPACPNCQRMERHFETVSGTVNVVIFPVTIEGREASLKALTPVMALPEAERSAAWKLLFAADAGIGVPGATQAAPVVTDETLAETARGAIGVNEVAFQAYRLPGTPWTISDDGRYVPQSVLSSPGALEKFLNGGDHDGQ